MTKKTITSDISAVDAIAFLLAIFYMQSVLTVAHHTSMWAHDGSTRIVEPPAVAVLVISLLLSGYSWYKKGAPSTLLLVSVTVLITASIFWLSGLRTNFYF